MVTRKMFVGLLAVLVFIPVTVYADSGVGVGTARIILPDTLPTGNNYKLPDIVVYNTGSEVSSYEMAVTLNEHQAELKPSTSWVNFSPRQFTLAPGEVQLVAPTLIIPAEAKSGSYYSYLEAHCVYSDDGSQATSHISAAAAAKFYFSLINSQPVPAKATNKDDAPNKSGALTQFLSQYSPYKTKTVGTDAVANTDKS